MERGEAIDTKQFLSRIGGWPKIPDVTNLERWLANFREGEEGHAIALLNSFTFIPRDQVDKIFESNVHALSAEIASLESDYDGKTAAWNEFLDTAIVTHPTGEEPNPSDSGYIFHRLMRQGLGFDEDQLVEPLEALSRLQSGLECPVLFVDDFAGSGTQFLDTWNRMYEGDNGALSFSGIAQQGGDFSFFYLPAVCTSFARDRIHTSALDVRVRPGHLLPEQFSINAPDTVLFPHDLRPTARAFVADSSERGGLSGMVFGYDDLGLAIGFEHSVPDATLQLIWDEGPLWYPLIRRS